MFNFMLRARIRQEARRNGIPFFRVLRELDDLDDETIEHSLQVANATVEHAKLMAIGDGSIIEAIRKFLESDLGKALIAMLMKLLFSI